MAIVRIPWVSAGPNLQAWMEIDDVARLVTAVIVRNETGAPIKYSMKIYATQEVLSEGSIQSMIGEQRFNIPNPKQRDPETIELMYWS